MSINLTDELLAKTKKGKIASAKQVFLEGDQENLQQIGEKTHQLEDAIKDITISGGASTANAVSYSNSISGMTAVTAQGAIDELAAKNKAQDVTIGTKAEKSEVATELNKKFNKENIAQEFGESKDKVVSQFALPFREIVSPEFIKAIVDTENHFLFGIHLDGSIEWGKGIPAPIRTKLQELINQCQQDKTDLLESINTLKGILDKTTIKDEEGTVVETPFRYIQNEEFIFAKVDANDKLLFGFQWDGTPVFGKTSVVEDRLQEQVNLLADKITAILGDDDTTSAIDTLKELKDFFASIDNTQTLTSILANLNATIDNVVIKDEAGEIQDTPFRVISNEEFIWAVVDSEDRVLFGFYRATGKPYYPLNEMYHVIQNEEYFAAWLDTDDKVVLGIRRDGEIIGEIHAVNALKETIKEIQEELQNDISSLRDEVGTIDTNLKELLDIFSFQNNPEYMAVEKDADGKVLSSTYNDGSHYSHNLKSETIDAKVDKEEGKSLINEDVADAHSTLEDPEGRTEITIDADGKVMSYRDSSGKKHDHDMEITNLEVSNLNLEGNSVNNIQEALKANGFDMKHPMDWSTKNELQIPEPYCAFVNITGSFPTSKGHTTKGEIQFYDMQGNYFKKFIEMDIHGRTSSMYKKKNYTFDFYNDADYSDAFTIKFGDWVSMDSFYFQGWYSDAFRGIDIIEYKLYQQMISTRGFLKDKPYKYSIWQNVTSKGNEDSKKLDNNLEKNALCTPMGFPVIMYLNGEFWGIYTIMLKKNRANFRMDKKDYKSVMLDLDNGNIVSGIKNWKSFEIRNPKVLICMDGSKYNGDAPKELIDESSEKYDTSNKDMVNTVLTKNAIVSLADSYNKVKELDSLSKSSDGIRTTIEKYYNVDYIIDYIIFSNLIQNVDGWGGNWQWTTWDGVKWNPNPYDLNASLGLDPYGLIATSPVESVSSGAIAAYVHKYYITEIKDRYKYLKNSKIISLDNIIGLFYSWIKRIGTDNYANEFKKWNSTPSQRESYLNYEYWDVSEGPKTTSYYPAYSDSVSYSKGQVVRYNSEFYQSIIDNNIGNVLTDSTKWKTMLYDENTTYEIGDELICTSEIVVKFKCIKSCIGQKPVTKEYDENFGILGFYDSIGRIYKWFEEKITYLDSIWNI